MSVPLVSIVTPLYNRASLVAETIASVQAQTFADWEMWVVDDGSTDGSYERVAEIAQAEPRIRLLRRDREPKGAPICRNMGAARAQGQYLLFLDSDDLLAPFCLEQRMTVMRAHPEVDFAVFAIQFFYHQPGDSTKLWNVDSDEDDLVRFLRIDALWQTMGPLYRTDYFRRTAGFREDLPFWQDYELHVRLLCQRPRYLKCFHLPADCYLRRHSEESISQGKKLYKNTKKIGPKVAILNSLHISGYEFSQAQNKALLNSLYREVNVLLQQNGEISEVLNLWLKCYMLGSIRFIDWIWGSIKIIKNRFFSINQAF